MIKKTDVFIRPMSFICLDRDDVITAKVSDHHPVIHHGVLFWNIMMQGKKRKDRSGNFTGYNNGFGIVESDKQYIARLRKIALVIAEIIYRNPTIEAITLCEGPIDLEHVQILFRSLMQFSWMSRFIRNGSPIEKISLFYKPNVSEASNWGLLMLADTRFKVSEIACDFIKQPEISTRLANRFQLWALETLNDTKYLALGHFPFGGDEHVTEKSQLSASAKIYCDLINQLFKKHDNEPLILCADFNLNPYLISQWSDRVLDQIPINNSRLLMPAKREVHHTIQPVTVDGILLSRLEKQKNQMLIPNLKLHSRLLLENGLFSQTVKWLANQHRKTQEITDHTSDMKRPLCAIA